MFRELRGPSGSGPHRGGGTPCAARRPAHHRLRPCVQQPSVSGPRSNHHATPETSAAAEAKDRDSGERWQQSSGAGPPIRQPMSVERANGPSRPRQTLQRLRVRGRADLCALLPVMLSFDYWPGSRRLCIYDTMRSPKTSPCNVIPSVHPGYFFTNPHARILVALLNTDLSVSAFFFLEAIRMSNRMLENLYKARYEELKKYFVQSFSDKMVEYRPPHQTPSIFINLPHPLFLSLIETNVHCQRVRFRRIFRGLRTFKEGNCANEKSS